MALREGRLTIGMTPGGQWLSRQIDGPNSPLTIEQATAVWERLSERFAEQASGSVVAFVRNPRPNGIFLNTELPALLRNRSLVNILSGF